MAQLVYVRLARRRAAGEERPIEFDDGTIDEHADQALAKLDELLRKFADPATPYYSLLHPMWTTRYGTYDHLARVQEWSLTGGDEATTGAANEQAARHSAGRHRPADRGVRSGPLAPGSPPTPAPARPTCWRSA